MFIQSTLIVNEDVRQVQLVLSLNHPPPTDITVQVFSNDVSASMLKMKHIVVINVNMLQEEVMIISLDHTLSHFLLE